MLYFLALYCCRDDSGRLVRAERLRTKDITQSEDEGLVAAIFVSLFESLDILLLFAITYNRHTSSIKGGVWLAFADEVLCWLYGTVKENEDYILQFAHPFTGLELLQIQSCPDEITQHVEQF